MKLEYVEVFHVRLPLKAPFRTSFGEAREQAAVIVKAHSDGLIGWGEADPSAEPRYSPECASTAFLILKDFLLPAVVGKNFPTALELQAAMSFVRGNQFAKSAIEIAFWTLLAEEQGKPLHQILGGVKNKVTVGVPIGIQDTSAKLMKEIERFLTYGYQRVKLKIKPEWDVDIVRQVRKEFPNIHLMVDANSAYTLQDAVHLKRLDAFNLMMIEQPLGYDDIVDHATLQAQIKTPIALDESIHSPDDARKAIQLGSGKIINIKISRVGGIANALKVHDICHQAGWPVWVGGMKEMGIGSAVKIEFASLPNVVLPSDIAPSDRYYLEDIVEPPIVLHSDGTYDIAKKPGIGRMVKETFIRANTIASFNIKA